MGKKEHGEEWYNLECEVCGKKYHRKPYLVGRAKHHYCSVACHREAKKIYMLGERNHQYGLRGKMNPTWKNGERITRYGYRVVWKPEHPFAQYHSVVLEHRLIAEKYLLNNENSVEIDGQRYLSPDYVVHHINGNRLDNRVENLKVMTKSEHQALHATEMNKRRERDEKGRYI